VEGHRSGIRLVGIFRSIAASDSNLEISKIQRHHGLSRPANALSNLITCIYIFTRGFKESLECDVEQTAAINAEGCWCDSNKWFVTPSCYGAMLNLKTRFVTHAKRAQILALSGGARDRPPPIHLILGFRQIVENFATGWPRHRRLPRGYFRGAVYTTLGCNT